MRKIVAVMGLALAVGCGPAKPTDEQAVLSAGDLGAIGCAAYAAEAKPEQLAMARSALAGAQLVLDSETPTMTLLEQALAVSRIDARWKAIGRALVQRIRVRVGDVDPLPRDSVGFRMATEFVSTCALSLG